MARKQSPSKSEQELIERILELKARRNAVFLVHNYQPPEVQDLADFLGDSLGLSQRAAETDADVIVFCGVHFMAETAAILSPEKIVLLPAPDAGCPMADMIDAERLAQVKAKHPKATVVSYVNTTAEVKALSDYCCTSANAPQVLEAIDSDEIIFVPDRWLAAWAGQFVDKKIYAYHGHCPTHMCILPEDIERLKREHPNALVVAHPECRSDVVAMADAVKSTSGMVKFCAESDAQEFVIATEYGLIYRLEKENPQKRFYRVSEHAVCPNMKKCTLEKILWALEDLEPRVTVPKETANKARQAIERMISIT